MKYLFVVAFFSWLVLVRYLVLFLSRFMFLNLVTVSCLWRLYLISRVDYSLKRGKTNARKWRFYSKGFSGLFEISSCLESWKTGSRAEDSIFGDKCNSGYGSLKLSMEKKLSSSCEAWSSPAEVLETGFCSYGGMLFALKRCSAEFVCMTAVRLLGWVLMMGKLNCVQRHY